MPTKSILHWFAYEILGFTQCEGEPLIPFQWSLSGRRKDRLFYLVNDSFSWQWIKAKQWFSLITTSPTKTLLSCATRGDKCGYPTGQIVQDVLYVHVFWLPWLQNPKQNQLLSCKPKKPKGNEWMKVRFVSRVTLILSYGICNITKFFGATLQSSSVFPIICARKER